MNYFYLYSHEKFSLKYYLHHLRGGENFVHNDFSILIIKGSIQYATTFQLYLLQSNT